MSKQNPLLQVSHDALNQTLSEAVSKGVAPGIVALASTPDGLIYEGAAGLTGPDSHAPMTPDTIFWILSMTKAVTAVACMQLVEQGKLHVDQLASDFLPELSAPQVLEGFSAEGAPLLRPAKRPITVRHLLTHTSGYTYSLWSKTLARYEEITGTPIVFSGKKEALSIPLEFDPGERWQYGMSIEWVGKLVELISGQTLEDYFREHIFSPLGMHDTGFKISDEQRSRTATAAQREADGTLTAAPYESPQQTDFSLAGTGLYSTPRNYMVFLQMLLNGGSVSGVKILEPETIAAMLSNQIGDINVSEMVSPYPARSRNFDLFPEMQHKWGFSFDINTQPGPYGRSAGSAAWAGAMNTHFWIDPISKVTGALFTQIWPFYDEQVIALYNHFEQTIYQGLPES
ncbi:MULTISPECIES: serine hydrolase domain-containing protein [unclassified Pantoea]|uniref:serine hydrolase domain-containing protein n=1 Tax=unclassified Pantoea TaxID=2630326 RepID=UPI00301C742D